jgi:CBS domain-containing protein
MIAKDIMTRDVVTVSPAASVKELAKTLVRQQISGAPVMNKKGQIVGVVSEADIVASSGKTVKDIMSKRVCSVAEETPVEEIAGLMTAHKISRLPVMRGQKLIGLVSRADIVGAIAAGKHVAIYTPVYDL